MIAADVTAAQVAAGLRRFYDATTQPGKLGRAAAVALLAAYRDGELLGPAGIRAYLSVVDAEVIDPEEAGYSVMWSSLATDLAAGVFTQRVVADLSDADVDVLRLALALGAGNTTRDLAALLERLALAGGETAQLAFGALWIALGRPGGTLVDSPAHQATNGCGGCGDEQLVADLSAGGATAVVHNNRPHTCGRPA